MIRVAVSGAAGRMGRMVLRAVDEARGRARVAGALEHRGHTAVGSEAAPGVAITDDATKALAGADVYIDFTVPEATVALAREAARAGVAAVIGTTGLSASDRDALSEAAQKIPVVFAPNFSLGVNLLLGLAERAARALGDGWDLEIVELHHRMKRDAPSGTAIALAESLARGRGWALDQVKRYAREGDVGPRKDEELGVMTVRGGDVVGEHTAYLFGNGERLELTHRATDRAIFARGAVRAALWVAGKDAGLYGMKDVLGLG